MKKTAVEWLVEQMEIKNPNWLKEEIEQAKEMEKQNIIDFLDLIKDYEKESCCSISDDDRSSKELVEIFIKKNNK